MAVVWQSRGNRVAIVWQSRLCRTHIKYNFQKMQCNIPEGLRLTDIIKQHFVNFEHVSEVHAPPTETCLLIRILRRLCERCFDVTLLGCSIVFYWELCLVCVFYMEKLISSGTSKCCLIVSVNRRSNVHRAFARFKSRGMFRLVACAFRLHARSLRSVA